jgi:3',5'-cyclic-AMP phosphodiesterase
VLIAQISDTHITAEGELLAGRVDSAANLARIVERIRALDTKLACVLATGDLTEHGTAEEYALFRALLAPLAVPVYAIPGNHDRREAMRAAFRDCSWMPHKLDEPVHYSIELGTLCIFALDTLVEGQDHGALTVSQLDWLDAQLAVVADRPAIVMLHHPPVNSGVRVMDAMKLVDPERLGEIVGRHHNIERVLCGHLHYTMHARWHGTTVSVSPSAVEQLHLAFIPDAPLASVAEPPGFQLHFWDEANGLISHSVPAGPYDGPFLYP